jgi:hypothetical protein
MHRQEAEQAESQESNPLALAMKPYDPLLSHTKETSSTECNCPSAANQFVSLLLHISPVKKQQVRLLRS